VCPAGRIDIGDTVAAVNAVEEADQQLQQLHEEENDMRSEGSWQPPPEPWAHISNEQVSLSATPVTEQVYHSTE
jgi:hypothetical protein